MKDLKDLKLYLVSYLSIFAAVSLFANENQDLLSSLKKEQIEVEKKINKETNDKLRFDWIQPVIASYTHTENGQFDPEKSTRFFQISLNQPIFKSGGIYFAIKYSSANRAFMNLATKIKEKNLLGSAFSVLLNLKKLEFEMQKQQLLIENAKIDILRKREQFESGLLDSSFLDNTILNKSKLEHVYLNMESSKFDLIKNFENISDQDYKTLNLPRFESITKDTFIKNNIEIDLVKSDVQKSRNLKNMTISNYFPTVSLFGNYNERKEEWQNIKTKNTYKNYGFTISMPLLDVNIVENIQIKRLEYLKSKLTLEDKKREVANEFEKSAKAIEILKKRVYIAKEDEKLYNSLLTSTTESYEAGEKTVYDVNTLKNSKDIALFDKRIFDTDIQIALLNLYTKMHNEI